MEPGRQSTTALMAAHIRAHHRAHHKPLIFDDPCAHRLLTASETELFGAIFVDGLKRLAPQIAAACADRDAIISAGIRMAPGPALILSRARYAEERLLSAIERGVRTYVLIGAGLDTFALRRPDLRDRVEVLEIDHPASQADKLRRLSEAGLDLPRNLRFAPVDLEQEGLAHVLAEHRFDPTAPAFFSWLGVIMYLREDTIWRTLRAIRAAAPSESEIVFDYLDKEVFTTDKAPPRIQRMMQHTRDQGEPMISGLDPRGLSVLLEAMGLRLVEDLSHEDVESRYCAGQETGFRAAEYVRFARVAVP